MRSVGFFHNVFAVETVIDELAFHARRDPLQFRLDNLDRGNHERAAALLQKVSAMAGWNNQRADDRGLGLAHYYFDRYPGSYLAQIAEVSLDLKSGVIRVHRIWSAVDCGTVIHPGQVEAQVEGGSVMGLSMALKEALTLEAGGVKASNFHDYPILRMNETPDFTTHMVSSTAEPGGIGDAAPPLVAPAVANGVFDLIYRKTGKKVRLRDLPMTPDSVRKALASA
jgi:isoquinoline 1-oxidoreductase subunit beta